MGDSVATTASARLAASAFAAPRRRLGVVLPVVAVVVTILLLGAGLALKEQCAAVIVDGVARQAASATRAHTLCYSDVQWLWWSRHLGEHIFPYLHGRIIPPFSLGPGEFDYPVLTGLFAWLAALGVATDTQFLLVTVLMLAPFAVASSLLLTVIAPRRSWMWWLAPALLLYSAYNWDLLPTTCVVIAAFIVLRRPDSLIAASVAAGVLGMGGAFKLYPLLFVPALALLVLFADGRARHWRRAITVAASGAGVFLLCNLPFLILGFRGWLAPWIYQSARPIDRSTLSIWYFAFRQIGDPTSARSQELMGILATATTGIALLAALVIGVLLARRGGRYPWLQVSAAMLCAYLLLNKVDSPQYILWLIPFFVLLQVRWPWVIAYYLCDLLLLIGFFYAAYFDDLGQQHTWASVALAAGVFGRAALLAVLFVLFLRAPAVSVSAASGEPVESAALGSATATNYDGTVPAPTLGA